MNNPLRNYSLRLRAFNHRFKKWRFSYTWRDNSHYLIYKAIEYILINLFKYIIKCLTSLLFYILYTFVDNCLMLLHCGYKLWVNITHELRLISNSYQTTMMFWKFLFMSFSIYMAVYSLCHEGATVGEW